MGNSGIQKSSRKLALQVLSQLNTGKGRARDILNKSIRENKPSKQDKSFLTELVYGTIRWRGNLDWIISQFVPPRKLSKLRPEVVNILRLGLYQLFFLNSVPDHAAVNESVEIAKKYGGIFRLVNAVLRRAARNRKNISYPDIHSEPVSHVSSKYSYPEWLVNRWIDRFGTQETIQLCLANNQRAPFYIRTNILKTSRDQLIISLEKEGTQVKKSEKLPESLEIMELSLPIYELSSYKQGWFQVQDESSMLASRILDPQSGETIIDACAAPGGKTTHIAELMGNWGKIYAFDESARRLPLILESCRRLGVTIVEAKKADARRLDEHLQGEKAHRVIADVPCSGLGVLRRRVEARWRRTPEQLREFPQLQYEILASVSRHVKSGGILVYCTCTIEPEENQQVVEQFLKKHPQFRLQSVKPFLPEHLQKAEKLILKEGYMQTYPHLHHMDGFFVARMTKD
jgi:16S rRNA (cytosine967-C5)-methyltransferase